MFDVNYRRMKENPLYSSQPELPRRSSNQVESSPRSSGSPDDGDDVNAPGKRKPVYNPNYGDVRIRILLHATALLLLCVCEYRYS